MEEGKKTDFQADLVIFWSLVKRQDSHAAVISQGQSHSPPPPPSLMWQYCSFVARAAGGAVRPGSSAAAPPLTHTHTHTRLSPLLSSFVLSPLSLASTRQCWATAASSSGTRAGPLWWGMRPVLVGYQVQEERDQGITRNWLIVHCWNELMDCEWELWNHLTASVQLMWFEVLGSVAWCLPRGHPCERY